MADSNCNIAQLAQVLIGGDFSATFLVEVPDNLGIEELRRRLECGLRNQFHDVSFLIREASPAQTDEDSPVTEPYVVTANGPDRPGLVVWPMFSRPTGSALSPSNSFHARTEAMPWSPLKYLSRKTSTRDVCAVKSRARARNSVSPWPCSTAAFSRPCTAFPKINREPFTRTEGSWDSYAL